MNLLVACLGTNGLEMIKDALIGLLRGAGALAHLAGVELLGGGEQRPTPTVLVVVLIYGIDKIFGNNSGGHLQTGDVAIELAAHLGAIEAAGGAQLARNQTAMLGQGKKDSLVDTALGGRRMDAAAIVAEVGPPLPADKAGLASKELTIDQTAIGNHLALPLPHRPVPTAIAKHHITTIIGHKILGRETADAAIQEWQKTYLLYNRYQLRTIMSLLHIRYNFGSKDTEFLR